MKRNFTVLAAALLLPLIIAMSYADCMKEKPASGGDKFRIVASFYPVYIIAKNVAEGVPGTEVINMTPPVTGCLHDYSITAADMKRLEDADILLINGAGMESFTEKIAKKYSGLEITELSQGIALIKEENEENPHVWVSITNTIVMTENCAKALSSKDPQNAPLYDKNSDAYIKRLEELKKEMHNKLGKYKGKKIITFHEAFPYFAKEFALDIAAVIEREPGSEPSAKELAETIETVKKSNIKALFAEPQYPSSSAGTIAKETGASVYVLDPAVTGEDNKDAYLNIMKKNLSILEKALHE